MGASNGEGLFLRERVLENMPTPRFEQPLKFIAHGRIFKRLQYIIMVVKLLCADRTCRVLKQQLTCIKAWVNEHACNGEYMDIFIMVTRK